MHIMFAINKKEAPIGTKKLFKKADPSNRFRLRQNHLNFEASFTPNDIIENNFPQAWNKLPPACYICHNQR